MPHPLPLRISEPSAPDCQLGQSDCACQEALFNCVRELLRSHQQEQELRSENLHWMLRHTLKESAQHLPQQVACHVARELDTQVSVLVAKELHKSTAALALPGPSNSRPPPNSDLGPVAPREQPSLPLITALGDIGTTTDTTTSKARHVHELEDVWTARFCQWCFERKADAIACPECHQAWYCCPEHMQMHQHIHEAVCGTSTVVPPSSGSTADMPPSNGASSSPTFVMESMNDIISTAEAKTKQPEFSDTVEPRLLTFEGESGVPDGAQEAASPTPSPKQLQKRSTSRHLSKIQKTYERNAEHHPFWLRFARRHVEVVMAAIVGLHAVFMILEVQWRGSQSDAKLNYGTVSWDPSWEDVFYVAEWFFLVLYVSDIFFRWYMLRWEWLYNDHDGVIWSNVFDAFVVLINAVDLIVLQTIVGVDDGSSWGSTGARLLKLCRLIRAFRIFRMMKLFRDLRLLVTTIAASLGALTWSMVLLMLLNMVGALILAQSLHGFIIDDSQDLEMRIWVNNMYGSFLKSMYTMFEVTHSGGWPNYARPLVERVDAVYGLYYILYVIFVIFAIIRIITALFIKETLAAAAADANHQMEEQKRQDSLYKDKLVEIFEEADSSGDGFVTREEFALSLSNPIVLEYLKMLDIAVHDIEPLFDLLDDGDGQVTITEFCERAVRMKGQARALDMVTLEAHVLQIGRKFDEATAIFKQWQDSQSLLPPKVEA